MLNVVMPLLLFVLGLLIGFVSFGYRILILSDIPVSYTASEAITAQILFFIASGLVLIALVSLKDRTVLGVTIGILTLALLFNMQVVRREMWDSGYDSSVVQLELAPVLHLCLLLLINVYLLLKNWKKK